MWREKGFLRELVGKDFCPFHFFPLPSTIFHFLKISKEQGNPKRTRGKEGEEKR